MIFTNGAWGQSESEVINLEISIRDFEEVDRCFQEREAMQDVITEQSGQIIDLKSRLDIEIQTNKLNEQIKKLKDDQLSLKDQEIRMLNESFNRMKDIADRAIQLEEKAQKRAFWEKLGAIGVVIGAMVKLFLIH
jgi:trehalose utilization protein